jgi:hypothetical protein
MLTLKQKFDLGTKGEWIALVQSAIAQIATGTTHEKPQEISFGDIQDEALADLPEIRLQQQKAAHLKRVALARSITGTRTALTESAQRAAILLAAAMAEDVAKVSPEQGTQVAGLMASFLALDAGGQLPAQQQAALDATILATVRGGWSALSGYNVHYEIPEAIANATA